MTRRLHPIDFAVAAILLAGCRRSDEPASAPGSNDLARALGAADAEDEHRESARLQLERVASASGATALDLANVAALEIGRRQPDVARIRDFAKRALEKDRGCAVAEYCLGVASELEFDLTDAVQHFQRAVELAPDDIPTKLHLGTDLQDLKRVPEAIPLFEAIRARGLDFAGSYYATATFRLAQCFQRGDDVALRARAPALYAEQKELTRRGIKGPEIDELRQGRLGKVRYPTEPKHPVAVAATAPRSRWIELPDPAFAPDAELRAGYEVRELTLADVNGDLRDDFVLVDGKGVRLLAQQWSGSFVGCVVAEGDFTHALAVDLENQGRASLLLRGRDGLRLLSPAMPPAPDGFVDETARLPPLSTSGGPDGIVPVDYDHDGDLDLLLVTRGGLRLVRNDGWPYDREDEEFIEKPNRHRTGPIRLSDASAALAPAPEAFDWADVEDFDADQDVDLLCGGAATKTILLSNLRGGRFERIESARSGLQDALARAPLLADLDHDARVDALLVGDAPAWQRNKGDGTFAAATALPALAKIARGPATLEDVNRDGEPDLVGVGAGGEVAARLGSLTLQDGAEIVMGGHAPRGSAPLLADLDDDADLDLVTIEGTEVRVRWCAADDDHHGLATHLVGKKDNEWAVGAVVETRIGERYERRFVRDPSQTIGLGDRRLPDLVRVTWPDGVVQYLVEHGHELQQSEDASKRPELVYWGLGDLENKSLVAVRWLNGRLQHVVGATSRTTERSRMLPDGRLETVGGVLTREVTPITPADGTVEHVRTPKAGDVGPLVPRGCANAGEPAAQSQPDTAVVVVEKPGPIASCPFLYSWNGERYAFVSDVLGATPLGLPIEEGMFVPPNHHELVRVDGSQLKPVDGEYRFQFTEELRETTYLDRAQLWVVEHPADVEVHPEERFCFPPFPAQHVHTVRGALPLVKAVDQEGRDWTDALARIDGVHAVPFRKRPPQFRGLATEHVLELTLPDAVKSAKKVRLLMTGWLEWGDASVNVAASRHETYKFVPPILSVPDGNGGWRECGPPVGFPAGKTKTMVLDVTDLLNREDPRLRLFATIELYWDCIRVAVDDDDAPTRITKLEPKLANLWHRGFSRPEWGRRPDQPARFDWDRLEPFARWNQHAGMLTRYGDVAPLLGTVDDEFVILSSGDAIDLRFDASDVAPPMPGTTRTYLLYLDGWAKDADPNTSFSQTVEPLPFHAMSGYPYRSDEHYPDDAEHAHYRAEWNTRPGRRLLEDLSLPRQ